MNYLLRVRGSRMRRLSGWRVLVGCSKRNDSVCCLTAADCESIGLSATDVGNRGCRDGESCIDLTCVPTPDARRVEPRRARLTAPVPMRRRQSVAATPTNSSPQSRIMPNLHVAYGEDHFALSSDELTGVHRPRQQRRLRGDASAFGRPWLTIFLSMLSDPLACRLASHAFELFPSRRQQHLLYVHARTVSRRISC